MKLKNDHRSKLAAGKKKPEKNQGFNGIRTRDLRDTGAMLYQLSYKATHRERGQLVEFISPVRSEMMCSIYDLYMIYHIYYAHNVWLHSSVGRASHRYRGDHGFEFR